MNKKDEILQILKTYEFGENLYNGGYIRGIKKREFDNVADDIVKLFAIPVVIQQSEQLFCGVSGGFCPYEKYRGMCSAEHKCINQVTK